MHSPEKSVDPARVLHPELLAPHKSFPGQARIIGCPNPFTAKCVDGWCPDGLTVREAVASIAKASGIPAGWAKHAHIWINGRKVPRDRWDEVQVREGQLLNFRIVPGKSGGGSGGKNPLRMVMSIAIMAAAWYAGPALLMGTQAGAMFANGALAMGMSVGTGLAVGSAVIGGGVALIGNTLADAIAPVSNTASTSSAAASTESDSTKTAYSLSGSSNSARKYEPVAVVLGRIRRQADHAASPYSEASGSDQWGHYLFSWGIGPLPVTDMKLGDTPLESFLKSSTRDILPEMEATTTANATITATVNSAEAWKIGNNSRNASDSFYSSPSLPVDVDIDLGSIRGMQGYSLRPHVSYLSYMPTDWVLFGGINSSDMVELDRHAAMSWVDGSKKNFELTSLQQVRYLRLHVTGTGTGVNLILDEFEVLGGLLIESWEGRTGDAKPTLYTGNTHEESIGALLPWEDFEESEYTVRHTEAGCTEFEIELYANQGLWRYPANTSLAYGLSVTVEALYRVKGTTHELKRVGVQSDAGWVVSIADVNSRADRRACRFTLSSGTLEAGQYEIYTRRIARDYGNSNPDDGTIFDSLYWSVLRTIRPGEPVTLEVPWSGTALCVKAGEDFSGSLPVLTGICASECLDWDAPTQSWITRQTSNPASLLRYWLQHPCRLKPWTDSRIDIAKLQRWHEFCAAKGFTFNAEAAIRDKSIMTVARMICAAGRGSPIRPDGIFSVVWDDVQDEIVQQYNDRNSWGFKAERKFSKIPHALRISFQDEDNDFEQDEITVYDDGYSAANASVFESLSFDGVTNANQLWKMGRNYLAQLRLRPWKYSITTDMQYLIGGRGKLVAMASATIKVGLVSARVKSVTWDEEQAHVVSVKLDQACAMSAGSSYALRYRRTDGTVVVRTVELVEYETQVLTFSEPVPAVIAPQEDSLCTFGVAGEDSLIVLVESIVTGDDETATIVGVDYSPAIFTADTGSIPPWESHITQSIYGRKVATPVIVAIRSGEETILVNADGTLSVRAEIVFSVPSGAPVPASIVELQHRRSGSSQWSESTISPVGVGAAYVTDVEEGVAYEFRARALATAEIYSAWSPSTLHTIIGKSSPPPALSGLYRQAGTIYWTYENAPVDLDGYRVRVAGGLTKNWLKGADWPSDGAIVKERSIDATALGSGVTTVMVKPVDTSGNEAETAASLTINLGEYAPSNLIISTDLKALGFPGTVTGGAVDGSGNLSANDTGEAYLADDAAIYLPQPQSLYLPLAYGGMSYALEYVPPIDAVPGTAYLELGVSGDGWAVSYRRRGNVELYLGHDDDAYLPDEDALYLGGPTPWAGLTGGIEVGYERIDFRIEANAGNRQGSISALKVNIDVDDIFESFEDLVILSTGTRLPITKTYRAIDYIGAITLQDDGHGATGVVIKDKDPVLGPLLAAVGASQATIDIHNLKGH